MTSLSGADPREWTAGIARYLVILAQLMLVSVIAGNYLKGVDTTIGKWKTFLTRPDVNITVNKIDI